MVPSRLRSEPAPPRLRRLIAVAVVLLFPGCSEGPAEPFRLRLVEVAAGLDDPVHLVSPPGDPRLFVIERPGRIRLIEDGQLRATPFLDLTARVRSGYEELGLLGMAFHPDFAENGFLFVNYTDSNGDTRIVRYTASPGADAALAESAKLILRVRQPTGSHNGGLVTFGPDGMLYIGMGDGHPSGDPSGDAQNLGTLLGALLRIDVDGGDPYAVPPDNPFVNEPGARPEIWAYGFRNPWRFAFDATAGRLYTADVGEHTWEEISIAPMSTAGLNFGWNVTEGAHCFAADPCESEGLVLPAYEYDRGDGCAVIGGHVYRGHAIPDLSGHYFFGDYCGGWVRSLQWDGSTVEVQNWSLAPGGAILSFGEDADGELYVLSITGAVHRIEAR